MLLVNNEEKKGERKGAGSRTLQNLHRQLLKKRQVGSAALKRQNERIERCCQELLRMAFHDTGALSEVHCR